MTGWRPGDYLKFADERTRPARDLLAQVPLVAPGLVYDLGCGPGNSTELLVRAYPSAEVIGIDNSPAMLESARKAVPSASFAMADLSGWHPGRAPDLLFSNATFQWLPRHLDILVNLAKSLPVEGVLAVQMPDNLGEPSHRLMAETAANGPWSAKLAGASERREAIASPQGYYNRLKPHFARLDIWHTIYNHPLDGVGGIVQWLMTTGLRPYLNALDPDQQTSFLESYRARLAGAYELNSNGTVLLRFPRIFMVGVR